MVGGLFFPNSGLKLTQGIVRVGDRLEMKKIVSRKPARHASKARRAGLRENHSAPGLLTCKIESDMINVYSKA